MSASNSNSMISKSPSSAHTLAGHSRDGDFEKEMSNCLNLLPGRKYLFIHLRDEKIDFLNWFHWSIGKLMCDSEVDHQLSISEASVELKQWDYSNSDHSIQSLKSIASLESHCEDDTLDFMRRFVETLFDNSSQLTLELKSEFGLKSRVIASQCTVAIVYLWFQMNIFPDWTRTAVIRSLS